MPLVSISEAARLTGKARSTLHKYIKQGKLSTTTASDNRTKKIDISELLRVFGDINATSSDTVTNVAKLQQTTSDEDRTLQVKLQFLELENTHLKAENDLLTKNLEDVRNAMLLIESKLPPTPEPQPAQTTKKPWQFWKK